MQTLTTPTRRAAFSGRWLRIWWRCLDILSPVLAILPWSLLVIFPALGLTAWMAGIGH
jgi:hypothetical protein